MIFVLEDIQDSARHGPEHPDLIRPVLSGVLYWIDPRDHFQPKLFCDRMIAMSSSVPTSPAFLAPAT